MATLATLSLDIIANTAALERSVEQTEGLMKRVESTAKVVGTAIAGAFAVTEIISAGKQVLDFAGNLTDLSAKTGISTSGLQKLQLAFEASGVSLDAVTSNTLKLSKAIIGGDKGAAGAMEKLGLSMSSLKQMAPEQQFITVADAIGKIENPSERAYAAMTIFGKGGAELLQGLDGHLQETTDNFEKMGLIIDDKTIAAADQFGDQIGMIGKQLLAVLANAIGPMLPALSALATAFSAVASVVGTVLGVAVRVVMVALTGLYSAIADTLGYLADMAQKIPIVGQHLGFLAGASDFLHNSAQKSAEMMAQLAFGTEATATAAKGGVAPLVGLGGAVEKVGKQSQWTSEQIAKINAQTELFDESTRRVELFNAVLTQDMLLQGVGKPPVLQLFSDINNELGGLQRIDLKSWAGADFGLAAPATAARSEMIRLQNDIKASAEQLPVTWHATIDTLAASFAQLSQIAGGCFSGITTGIGTVIGAVSTAQTSWDGLSKSFGEFNKGSGLKSLLGSFTGIVGGIGGIVAAASAAVSAIKAIYHAFQSEETLKVNKPRDAFFAEFDSAGGLAKVLTDALIAQGVAEAGSVADNLIKTLYDADTEAKFNSARDAIRTAIGAYQGLQSASDIAKNAAMSGQYDIAKNAAMGDAIPMANGGIGRVTKAALFLAGEGGAEDYMFSGGGRSFSGGTDNRGVIAAIERLGHDMRDLPRSTAVAVMNKRALA